MLRDLSALSPPPPLPPTPSPTHLEIEQDEQWKTGLSKPHGDTERGFDGNSENRYRSGGKDDERGELYKSVHSTENDSLEEVEDGVTNPQQSHSAPPIRDSSIQPSHSKSLLPQRVAPSRWRQPPNFYPKGDNDDEDLDMSHWQRHGSRTYFSSEPTHQDFSGSLPTVPRPVLIAPGPSGIVRTLAYPTVWISSPVPCQLVHHCSVRSTSGSAAHHPSCVMFASPGSLSIDGSQRFPEETKQGIAILGRPIPPRDVVDEDQGQQSIYSVPRIRIMCSRQGMDSEQVDVPWDIKEAQQLSEQAMAAANGHVEEGVRLADSLNNMFASETEHLEADDQTWEASVQTIEADTRFTEEELRHRESEVARLEERVQQALDEVEQLESGARQAKLSAKMLEASARQKETEARSVEAELGKLEAEVQDRETKVRLREEEVSKNEEKVRRL
jgi:hypothetical protein